MAPLPTLRGHPANLTLWLWPVIAFLKSVTDRQTDKHTPHTYISLLYSIYIYIYIYIYTRWPR